MADMKKFYALFLFIGGIATNSVGKSTVSPMVNEMLQKVTADLTNKIFTDNSSVINLTADPLVFQPALTRKLTIRCSVLNTSVTAVIKDNPGGKNEILNQKKISLTSAQDDVTNLLSVVITKVNDGTGKNEVVARVAGCLAADVEVNVLGQVEIEGNTEGSPVAGEAGYLQLTWDRPLENSAGVYTCEVSALNSNKHSISLNTTVRVQAEQPSISYLSMYISQHDRHIESLTKRTVELEQENQNLIHWVKRLHHNVSASLTNLQVKMDDFNFSEVQVGTFTCDEISQTVMFQYPYFKTTPSVFTSLSNLTINNFSRHSEHSTKVLVSDVTETEFTVTCSVSSGSVSAEHIWIAVVR